MTNGFVARGGGIGRLFHHHADPWIAEGLDTAHQGRVIALFEDDDFKVRIPLLAQPRDELEQSLGTVERADDGGYEHGGRRTLFGRRSTRRTVAVARLG